MSYVERVDTKRPGEGGYGFSNEWLKNYEILSYFHGYQRISENDLLYFVKATRYNVICNGNRVNSVAFLEEPSKRIVKMSEQLNNSFAKYELREELQRII